ncbi:MAG: hypothetical protein J5903_02440, partial [Clostridia bacterium]|nr:hypothetical protein [Clostridia bacterium]
MPSASESGGVVTNGMSLYKRDGINANSALLCEVNASDFPSGVLGGVEFQRMLERKAFAVGGGYEAPAQKVGDFLKGQKSKGFEKVLPTYPIGVRECELNDLLPAFITENLKVGLAEFNNKIKGFAEDDAVLTGVETRSSSPVRILRGENFSSIGYDNLYPCGEGCGYAGGIMSAATDGIKVARANSEKYFAPKGV